MLILGLITRYSGSLREGLGIFAQRCDGPYNLDAPMAKYFISMLFPIPGKAKGGRGRKHKELTKVI